MHLLRIHVQQQGEAAERLLAALAERPDTSLIAHGSHVRGLRADGSDRDEILASAERELDRIALSLGVDRWSDHLHVS